MAQQIAAVIEPELARLEREAAVRRPPVTLGAWDCYQRGLYHLWGFTTPGLAEAEAMFRRAIELDPDFARAHGALAYVKLQCLITRCPHERPALLEDALRDGRVAVALDGQDCMNLCVVGRILCFMHQYEEAIAYLEQAIRTNPSFAQAYFALGFTLIVSGRAGDGLPYLDRSVELSPSRSPPIVDLRDTGAGSPCTWRAGGGRMQRQKGHADAKRQPLAIPGTCFTAWPYGSQRGCPACARHVAGARSTRVLPRGRSLRDFLLWGPGIGGTLP